MTFSTPIQCNYDYVDHQHQKQIDSEAENELLHDQAKQEIITSLSKGEPIQTRVTYRNASNNYNYTVSFDDVLREILDGSDGISATGLYILSAHSKKQLDLKMTKIMPKFHDEVEKAVESVAESNAEFRVNYLKWGAEND